MNKSEFLKKANLYIKDIKFDKPFKLKHILGENCPAYPGTWLFKAVKSGSFNNSTYIVEWLEKDYSDTYIKKPI